MNLSRYIHHLAILCSYVSLVFTAGVKDVTKAVQLNNEGIVAGYGDFNSDKYTDVFIISDQWTTLYSYLWDGTKLHFKSGNKLLQVHSGHKIVSIALADFDGDGNMDILLCSKKSKQTGVIVHIYHGNMNSVKKGNFTARMSDQPTLVDVNGDLLPDLFGTNNDTNIRSYWISVQTTRSFELQPQFSNGLSTSLIIPSSNAFVDVTEDLHPDLFIKSINEGTNEIMFETWEYTMESKNMTLTNTVILNIPGAKHVGQISFADIDSDSKIDMILPVCMTSDCTKSVIYRRTSFIGSMEWEVLLSNDNQDWQFPTTDMTDDVSARFPVTLRFNDVTMDGMVDAVAILQKKGGKRFAAYLKNEKCFNKFSGCTGSRELQVNKLLSSVDNPVIISLLDVYENGALDFMITCRIKGSEDKFHTKVLRNNLNFDTAFLKVAVLSGAKKTATYGSNQIGAMVEIQTTNTDGSRMMSEAAQLCQSAYYALQLPYVIFGLGRSPNFVEQITVGISKGPKKVNRMKSWTAIIPNAQVIVIPYPKDNPYDWVTKLLVTPGKLILQTAGVLIGTILVICGIILILHIKEKKEDEREKRKEAHKFHFDAL